MLWKTRLQVGVEAKRVGLSSDPKHNLLVGGDTTISPHRRNNREPLGPDRSMKYHKFRKGETIVFPGTLIGEPPGPKHRLKPNRET